MIGDNKSTDCMDFVKVTSKNQNKKLNSCVMVCGNNFEKQEPKVR